MKVLSGLISIVVVLVVVIAFWQFGRVIHYNLAYKNMVENTVCEMVKDEYLGERGCGK